MIYILNYNKYYENKATSYLAGFFMSDFISYFLGRSYPEELITGEKGLKNKEDRFEEIIDLYNLRPVNIKKNEVKNYRGPFSDSSFLSYFLQDIYPETLIQATRPPVKIHPVETLEDCFEYEIKKYGLIFSYEEITEEKGCM